MHDLFYASLFQASRANKCCSGVLLPRGGGTHRRSQQPRPVGSIIPSWGVTGRGVCHGTGGLSRDGGSVTGTRCASRRARHNWFYFGKVSTPSIMIRIAAGVFSLGTDLAKMCAMPAIRSIAAAAAVMTHQPPPSLLKKRVSQTHSIQARCFKHQHRVAMQQPREIRWIVRVLNPAPHTACVACAVLQTQGTR